MRSLDYHFRTFEVISDSDIKEIMLSIGVTLRKLRLQKGYKNAECFAFTYQINRSAYYGWENGKNISVKKLIIVCEALDMSLLEFFQLVKLTERKSQQEYLSTTHAFP